MRDDTESTQGTTSGRPEGRPSAGEGGSGPGARGRAGWGGLADLQETVVDVVDSALRGLAPAANRFPRADLVRGPEGGYRLLFDLPGVPREALEVTTAGDELTVSGAREVDLPEGAEIVRSERFRGRFRRTVRMPPEVDAGRIRARLEDGVLEVHLPRRSDARAQRVEVEG